MAFKYQRRASWQPAKPKKPKQSHLGQPGQQNWSPPKASGPSTLGGVIPGPSPAPAPAPSLSAQPLPFDAQYNNQIGLNQQGYNTALGEINYGRQQTASDYGYTYDPTANGGFGAITGLDTSNPYNQATMLQRAYQQSQRALNTGMSSRGQLYSGAYQRGVDEGTFQYSRNEDALKRQALSAFDEYRRAEQGAKSSYDQGNVDAYGDWVGRSKDLDPPDPGIDYEALARLIAYENSLKNAPTPIGKTPNVKRGVSRAVGNAYRRNRGRF